MSFRDIGVIRKKADRESGYTIEEPQPKSPESRPLQLFSEGKSPIEVAIALDLDAGTVRAIYHDYWELQGMYQLAQIYNELVLGYGLFDLIKLHKIFKDLGMGEPDIHKVLELAKHNQLELLQGKVEYLRNEVNMLEFVKTNATNHILKLNKTIDEFEGRLSMYTPWLQNRGETAYMNQGTESCNNLHPIPYSWYDSAGNSYPIAFMNQGLIMLQGAVKWYSLDVSYTNDYWD